MKTNKRIIVNSQEELDKINLDFKGQIVITGGSFDNPINLSNYYPNAFVSTINHAVLNLYSHIDLAGGHSHINVYPLKNIHSQSQVFDCIAKPIQNPI